MHTSHLYAIDTTTWSIIDEVAAPGKPYGMTSFGGALRVVISHGEDDDRYLYRFIPGDGFDSDSKTACPDLTGSHLASDGSTLYLLQMTNQRLLTLDSDGDVLRTIALPSRCAGIGFASRAFFAIEADEEFDELHLATLDVKTDAGTMQRVASLPEQARGLAFDGAAWWTSHRELNEIVSFAVM